MYNVTTLFYTVMILTHHLQCCHSLMILWLWFCSKHNKEKSVWVLSWWITVLFSPVVYIPGAELDSSSSSFSLWMIKQRLWKQLWWRAWHFSLPECCCLSIEEEKDKSCSYQCVCWETHMRGRLSPVTQRSLSQQMSTHLREGHMQFYHLLVYTGVTYIRLWCTH